MVKRIIRKNKNIESRLPLTISAQYGLIDQKDFFDRQIASKDISGYYLLKKGEFAYNKSYSNGYPWGAVKRLDSYEMGILSTLYITFTPTSIVSEFLVQYYAATSWHTEIAMYAAEGARNHGLLNISVTDFFDTNLLIPFETAEQTAIGNFFRTLDDIITLQQRKLDKLRELKRGYLQVMFPQKGGRVPRVRFAGFSGDWVERKLGEVVERITKKNQNLESMLPLTISAQYGLISQTEFFDKQVASHDISNYYLLRKGDFAYNKSYSNGYPWGAVKRLEKYDMGVLSTLYVVFKPTHVVSDFLACYYETAYWYNEVAKHAAEGARNHGLLNIASSDFFETLLMIPSEISEQTAIGNFFRTLDEQIAAQQTKLNKLKRLKAAYLQNMFI